MRYLSLLFLLTLVSCGEDFTTSPQSDPSPPPPHKELVINAAPQVPKATLEKEIADLKAKIVDLKAKLEQTELQLAFYDGPININSCSKQDLMKLPRCGAKTADAIIKWRPITAIKQLLGIPGVGEKTVKSWEPWIILANK